MRAAEEMPATMKNALGKRIFATAILFAVIAVGPVHAQDEKDSGDAALAKTLSNPIGSLISVPIQYNYDSGYGPSDGNKGFINVQPVIPFQLSDNLTLVVRTIIPFAWQENIAGDSGSQFGLGDVVQSGFLVPRTRATALGSMTWGVGAAINWPTSTDRLLGSGTWGLGPTGVVFFQNGHWGYGALINQLWGIDKTRSDAPDLSNMLVQPFLSYTTATAWSFALSSESSFNWTANDTAIAVNLGVSKLMAVGEQAVQLQLGLRYWAKEPDNGPSGVGFRFTITFLFPT